MESLDKKEKQPVYVLILIFIVLSAGIAAAGYLSYRNYANQYRVEVERQLSAIAGLKVGELAHWRKERIGNAAVFYGNKAFSSLVHQYFNNPNDHEVQRQLWTWLSKVQLLYSYERLLLFDARGALRMSVPDSTEPVASGISQRAAIVMRSEQINFQDFYRDELDQRIYLTIMIPILGKEDGSRALGALVLRIDPESYLYPYISSWPTPSQTAETLLARREGNEVVFLNDLRFQKNTALNLRFPLEKRDLPPVKAILGEEGIVEGKDYRGVPVIAAIRAIPDSPWFLSARMDLSEVYGPLKERLYLTIILVVALLIGIGTGIGLVWRQQHIRFYRERHEAAATLRESEKRLLSITEGSPIPAFVIGKDHRILYWNRALEQLSQIPAGEVIGTTHQWRAFYAQERPCMADLLVDEVIDKIPQWYEGKYIRSGLIDGAYEATDFFPNLGEKGLWLHFTAAVVLDSQGNLVGAMETLEDITDRKQAEEALQESEDRYRRLVENASDMVYKTDENGYFTFVNPAVLRITGYEEEEIIGKHYKILIRPDMFKEVITFFANQLIKGIQNTYYEYPIVAKDGHEIWIGQNLQLIMEEGTVTGFQAVARDITEMKQAEEKIQQMAYHDSLTGLPNRKLFSDRLGIALAQAQRNQKKAGIAMLDLDNFKGVNDTLGHDVGDLLLKAAAERLRAALRKGDTVARFGGDEFVLILPDLKGTEDVIHVAQKIVDSFRKPFLIDAHQLIVTTSIGIAVYPHDGTDEGILLKNADKAMYQVKQTGRDRYQLCQKA
jgi:diguanylate cyclase (GGDEF)-like protein/PAS domain S-box-containing protein